MTVLPVELRLDIEFRRWFWTVAWFVFPRPADREITLQIGPENRVKAIGSRYPYGLFSLPTMLLVGAKRFACWLLTRLFVWAWVSHVRSLARKEADKS